MGELERGGVQRSDNADLLPRYRILLQHPSFYGRFHAVDDPTVVQTFQALRRRASENHIEWPFIVASW